MSKKSKAKTADHYIHTTEASKVAEPGESGHMTATEALSRSGVQSPNESAAPSNTAAAEESTTDTQVASTADTTQSSTPSEKLPAEDKAPAANEEEEKLVDPDSFEVGSDDHREYIHAVAQELVDQLEKLGSDIEGEWATIKDKTKAKIGG